MLSSPLSLLGIAFVGTFFWPVNPEAAGVLCVTRYGWHPLLVGVIGASGQLVAQAILILGGDQIRRRWGWFDRRCERARQRFGKILARSAPLIGFTSGLLSLPPTSVTAALAPRAAPARAAAAARDVRGAHHPLRRASRRSPSALL